MSARILAAVTAAPRQDVDVRDLAHQSADRPGHRRRPLTDALREAEAMRITNALVDPVA